MVAVFRNSVSGTLKRQNMVADFKSVFATSVYQTVYKTTCRFPLHSFIHQQALAFCSIEIVIHVSVFYKRLLPYEDAPYNQKTDIAAMCACTPHPFTFWIDMLLLSHPCVHAQNKPRNTVPCACPYGRVEYFQLLTLE